MESTIEEHSDRTVDRTKVCPILVRVFCSRGRHNLPSDFARGKSPDNELQIYTWLDASLKELTNMIRAANPDARRRGTRFDFAVVYADVKTPGYKLREIGSTTAGRSSADDSSTLAGKRFQIGDLIDVAVTNPRPMLRGARRGRPY